MRLAVFTSKYPARVATFFERDMRALLEAGIDIEIFPIYPLEPSLWHYSLDILSEYVLPRSKVHHISLGKSLRTARPWKPGNLSTFLRDTAAVSFSAAKFGTAALAKSVYVYPKACAWAQQYPHEYDHILAYWGNYAATAAYIFHRLMKRQVPFSMWLHAGTDLYRNGVYLRQKLLYSDNIVTCCEFNRKFLQDEYSDIFQQISGKILVCYHGLDFAEFPYEPKGRPERKVIAVGKFDKNKGFDYLLRAAHELSFRGINIEVELVGAGEQAGSLRELVNELRMADRVKFRGWLPFTAVQAAMRGATILVHPSDGIGDGLPNVIRESMALGTPVIASRVAGIPEALDNGRCGLLVPPKDVKALADGIQTLLKSEALRFEYANLARRYAEAKFDLWQNGKCLADRLQTTQRPN